MLEDSGLCFTFILIVRIPPFSTGRNVFSVKAVSYGAKDYDDGKLSEIFVDDTFYKNFTLYGHYILPFNMTTGKVADVLTLTLTPSAAFPVATHVKISQLVNKLCSQQACNKPSCQQVVAMLLFCQVVPSLLLTTC